MQDAAYQSLLRSRRRELHRAAAEAFAARVAAGRPEPPELLAQHLEAAGDVEHAVAEWKRAGDRARYRYANAEAERHYQHALGLLATLPETDARLQLELAVQIPLAVVVGVTRGYDTAEHEASTARAQELFARLGGERGQAMTLLSDAAGKISRGDLPATRDAAERLIEAGLREGSRSALTWGHYLASAVALHFGELARAQEHMEQGVACFREEDYVGTAIRPGPLVYEVAGRILALRGFPERAEAQSARSLAVAERSDSPLDRFGALVTATLPYVYLRDAATVAALIERAYALDLEQRPPCWLPLAEVYRTWAGAVLGNPQVAVAELHEAIDGLVRRRGRVGFGFNLGLLAEVQLLAGHTAEGLETVARGLDEFPDERVSAPEFLRIRAELRAATGAASDVVEADLRESIALSREIGTRLFELRAAASLARMLLAWGRAAEAREVLEPVYATFTEGFGARDLVDARSTLEALATSAA